MNLLSFLWLTRNGVGESGARRAGALAGTLAGTALDADAGTAATPGPAATLWLGPGQGAPRPGRHGVDGPGPAGPGLDLAGGLAPVAVARDPYAPGPAHPREYGISAALELVVYATAFMLLVGVLLYGGRLALANVAVSSAAAEAARAASLTRTPGQATSAATFTANDALDAEDLRCGGRLVEVDTADYGLAVGQTGEVTVTVSCTLDNADLVTVGVPGTLLVSHSASSPLDAYRLRG